MQAVSFVLRAFPLGRIGAMDLRFVRRHAAAGVDIVPMMMFMPMLVPVVMVVVTNVRMATCGA